MSEEFVAQSYWDSGYEMLPLAGATPDDPIRAMLNATLPRGGYSCLEFGCYPGRYLAVLGEMGYELNGVDLTPKIETTLPIWLGEQGFRVGTMRRGDVFEFDPGKTFDVVCSFGLIEHFENWEELFARHAEFVRPGGFLVITTPNFRSWLQHGLHLAFDRVNLARHNLDAMAPERWRQLAITAGFETVACGGIGRFDFWGDVQRRNLLQKVLLKGLRMTRPLWQYAPAETLTLAPYYAIVARRPA